MAQSKDTETQGPGVLLIDDSRLFLRMFAAVVLEAGAHVVGTAEGGVEGARQASSLRPDIIILDHSMPDINGLACLRDIRGSNPEVKVIVCAAELDWQIRQQYTKLGVSGIFTKPVPLHEFHALLVSLIKPGGAGA